MSKNTGIRIETVKEVSDKGEVGFKVLSAAALTRDKLPALYLNSTEKPVAYLGSDGDISLKNCSRCYWRITPEAFYTVKEIKTRLAHIRAAGQHLADVNAHLRKERDTWNGKVTFVDGVEQEQKKDILSKKHSAEQLYKITDGSWNLCSTKTDPIMKHFPDLDRCIDNKYRIIDQGCDLPAYSPAHLRAPKRNDTIVQNVDTGQIVFTCKRFLLQGP